MKVLVQEQFLILKIYLPKFFNVLERSFRLLSIFLTDESKLEFFSNFILAQQLGQVTLLPI